MNVYIETQAAQGDQQRHGAGSGGRSATAGALLPLRRLGRHAEEPDHDGEFVAEDISYVDEKSRAMFFTAAGARTAKTRTYMHFYRVEPRRQRHEAARSRRRVARGQHAATRAGTSSTPASRVNAAPKIPLLRRAGNGPLAAGEGGRRRRLIEAGFKFPEPFKVKADDGITDLYGVMYKPFDFDPAKKYPIIAYVYPGPQTESVTKTFNPRSNQHAAGAIRVHRDRSRQPRRQPAPLEVVSHLRLRQPARLRPGRQEGRDRAAREAASVHRHRPRRHLGPLGRRLHDGRGDAGLSRTSSRWRWSESGNHENNIYNNTWSEKHHGMKEVDEGRQGRRSSSASRRTPRLAKNLKGHLMLIDGRHRQQRPPEQHATGWPTR